MVQSLRDTDEVHRRGHPATVRGIGTGDEHFPAERPHDAEPAVQYGNCCPELTAGKLSHLRSAPADQPQTGPAFKRDNAKMEFLCS